MTARIANNLQSILVEAINTSTTQIRIDAEDAARCPQLSDTDWFPLTLSDPRGFEEIIHVTKVNGDRLNVQRGQEGTKPQAFQAGSRVDLRLTAEAIESFLGLYFGARLSPPKNVPIGSLYLNTATTPNTMMALGSSGWAPAVTISVAGTRQQIYVAQDGDRGPFQVDGGFSNGSVNVNGISLYPGYGVTFDRANATFTLNTAVRTGTLIVFEGYLANDVVDIYTKTEVNGLIADAIKKAVADARIPVGTIMKSPTDTALPGTLKANGGVYLIATYPELYAVLGNRYGGNGITTFAVPEMRGEFLRGADDGRGVDPGRKVGSYQGDAIRNITAELYAAGAIAWQNAVGAFFLSGTNAGYPSGVGNIGGIQLNFSSSRVVPTAPENRPRNIAALYCIKY